jgi:hypothetical protein
VSYSFYLWHWPLIALYNARTEGLTNPARFAILALALLASVISYRYVERPFRLKPYRRSARATLLIAASAMASVAVLAVGIPVAAARLRPADEMAEVALKYLKYKPYVGGSCFLSGGFDDTSLFQKDVCLKLVPGRRNVLIVGDSHAAHFVSAFKALHPELDVLQATASGCEALRKGSGPKRCTQLYGYIFDDFLRNHHVDTIALASLVVAAASEHARVPEAAGWSQRRPRPGRGIRSTFPSAIGASHRE